MTAPALWALILWAFAQWGVPAVPVDLHIEHIGWTVAFSTPTAIYVDEGWLASAPEARVRSTMLHETGHVIGLDHYGDCNSVPAIMGCATLGTITDFDRAKLAVLHGYRVAVPMLSR